jgi:hypothetical protein
MKKSAADTKSFQCSVFNNATGGKSAKCVEIAKSTRHEVTSASKLVEARNCPRGNSENSGGIIKHRIQLQLADSNGFPVIPASDGTFCPNGTDTRFWVDLEIVKIGPTVNIYLPLINFQVGQVSPSDPYCPGGERIPGYPSPGGYLYTSDGWLPENLRPLDACPRSVLVPSNNGLGPSFTYLQDACSLTQPPVGYIVEIRDDGSINIQCAGTFGNIIPLGPHVIAPCSISYIAHQRKSLSKNIVISTGATDITQFSNSGSVFPPLNIALRDLHNMDAYGGKVVWTWADNSMVADKTNGVTNVMVRIGHVSANETITLGKAVQLTNFEAQYPTFQFMDFNTEVTIIRAGPFAGRIVVSYGVVEQNFTASPVNGYIYTARAVSIDGGQTWPPLFDGLIDQPLNGRTNLQPTGPAGAGDVTGVYSDKYGNVFYVVTNHFDDAGNFTNNVTVWNSVDGGDTYNVLFTIPIIGGVEFMDYPTVSFGTKADGQYGLYFAASFGSFNTNDAYPSVGFLPIDGFDLFGPAEFVTLPELAQALATPNITASNDGRVWIQGNNSGVTATPYTYIQPTLFAFKSPGEQLDANWSGAWDINFANNIGETYGDNGEIPSSVPVTISQPLHGFILNSTQSILFDESRQALYAMFARQSPDYSQDMIISLVISRNNGMTWSLPIDIATTNKGNRGFQTMVLNEDPNSEQNPSLIFGWYDGRNDSTYKSLEYFGAAISAVELDKLVSKLTPANPNFLSLTQLVVSVLSSDGSTVLVPPIVAVFTNRSPQNTLPITATAEVVNPPNACSALSNFTRGNIAVVLYDRACGSRTFVGNTESAGAVATVIIICCDLPINSFGGTSTQTAVTISQADGSVLLDALAKNPGARITIKTVPIFSVTPCT